MFHVRNDSLVIVMHIHESQGKWLSFEKSRKSNKLLDEQKIHSFICVSFQPVFSLYFDFIVVSSEEICYCAPSFSLTLIHLSPTLPNLHIGSSILLLVLKLPAVEERKFDLFSLIWSLVTNIIKIAKQY